MKWIFSRTVWGALLVLAGIAFLLQNLNLFQAGNIFWMLVIGLGGAAFLSVYFENKVNWWAIIPGVTLLAVTALILVNTLFPQAPGSLGAALMFAGIGLSFILIYLINRAFWWAIIPAGVLGTLALVTLVDSFLESVDSGGFLLIGIGLTFALVGILPNPSGKMTWAFIPAAILGIIGVILLAATVELVNYIWPVALILGGLIILWRALRK